MLSGADFISTLRRTMLTNGMKFVDQTVLLAIKQVLDGTSEGNIHVLGVAERCVSYSPNLLPDDGD